MARRTRMIGVAGLLAIGAGLGLAAPAAAGPTPTATLDIPDVVGVDGEELCTANGSAHQWIFELRLAGPQSVPVKITEFKVNVNGTETDHTSAFSPPSPPEVSPGETTATAVVNGPAGDGTVSATVKIQSENGEDPDGEIVTISMQPKTFAACGPTSPTVPTSTTSSSSTSSTSSTSTTTGDTTTTTVAGSTTSTSTTLGPNDTTGSLTVSPTTIAQGSSFTVAGTGFAPNVDVTVTLFSDPIALGTLRSNSSGAISGSLSMPATAPAGAHKIEAKGPNAASGNNILSANVQVTARTGSTIARTGDSADLLLPIGIAVVSFGILAFAWRERRLTKA